MRDWITGVVAVLGVLMVLGGATILVLRALAATPKTPVSGDDTTLTPGTTTSTPTSTPMRLAGAARQLPDADRLIAWGLGLLLLALIAAGAISFNFSGQAGD
jgi:hypothetical protein